MPFFPTDIENKSLLPINEDQMSEQLYAMPLSLDRLLIANAPATFFARVVGAERDLLIVDKSAEIVDGAHVVVYFDGEFQIKRYVVEPENRVVLVGEGSEPILLSEQTTIWGRVTYYIKGL